MARSPGLYSLLRKLPFKEVVIPIKILQGSWKNRNLAVPPFEACEREGGALEVIDGVPVLRLRGSAYQCGYQHGVLLREHVRIMFERYLRLFAGRYSYDLERARHMQRYIPKKYMEEMRGLADGAEIPFEEVLVSTCFLDIHKVAACSTFVVHDQSSVDGEIMMGRNLDFPSLRVADRTNMVTCYEQEEGEDIASVNWPGFLGCITGMNAKGLSLAMMLVYGHTRSDHLNGIPFALHYRDVLETSANVEEAVQRFQKREYAVCNNIMLADASRDAARLELHTRSVGVERNRSDFPVLSCTNHFRTGHRRYSFAFTGLSSYPRLWRMQRAARKREAYSSTAIKDILADVAIGGLNLQRVLFYPERGELEVGFGTPSRGPREYVKLSRELLFSDQACLL